MTISVLMSTYYKEKPDYLERALLSIWDDQERKPDQIVLVEDGKLTNELYVVIDKWKIILGEVLTIVANDKNKGLATALNSGIEACTGDLIARMDSDDISMPERFKLQEEFMITHKDIDILGGSILEFNDEGTLHNIRSYSHDYNYIYNHMAKGSPVAHPTVMFRKRFFEEGFRYSPKYYVCEDITLWFEALKAGEKICNIPEVILKFRRNDSTLKRRGRKKACAELRAYCKGIHKLYGLFSFQYIYPMLRFLFRIMPTSIIRTIYNSKLRNKILNNKTEKSKILIKKQDLTLHQNDQS